MKKIVYSIFFSTLSFFVNGQVMLQVQPCATTANAINVSQLGFAYAVDGWNTPDLTDPNNSVSGLCVYADDLTGDPLDACESIQNDITGKIVFIKRGTCEFGFKALEAQNAGAAAVVIVNNVSGGPINMPPGSYGGMVVIPVVMIAIEYEDLPDLHPNCTFYLGVPPSVTNDIALMDAFQSINNRPYFQIPASQLVPNQLSFNATIKNNGLLDQTNAKFVVNYNSVAYTQSLPLATLAPNISQDVTAGVFNPVANPGMTYDFVYEATSDQTDQNVLNNTIDGQFKVTDYILAKDKYSAANPTTFTLNGYYEFVTVFDVLVEQRVYGIDFKIAPIAQNVGQNFSYIIYDNNYAEYGSGDYTITTADLSQDIITAPMYSASGWNLPVGTYYVMAYTSPVFLAASGEADANSVYVTNGDPLTPAITSYPITKTPIIRLNFNCQIIPNPSSYSLTPGFGIQPQSFNCAPACNAQKLLQVNGSDELRLFDENNSLIQSYNNINDGQFAFENLCTGNYKVVGERTCFNLVSDTLYFIVEDRTIASAAGINSSTCVTNDGSATVDLFSNFAFNASYFSNYNFTLNWSGSVSGSKNVSGTNSGFLPLTLPTIIGGNLLPNPTGSFYTLIITDNIDGCVYQTTFTVDNDIPTQDVCVVTVDEVTGNHNIIAWERPADDSHIEKFKIYREITTDNYQVIGIVDVNDLTLYEDLAADPNATGYRYKVAILDVCGEESDLGNFHNTIHLQYLGTGNFQWSQYAIENESNPVASYNVYRDDNGTGNFQILPNGVVPGTQSTYTDVNYSNFPNAIYVVDVNWISTTGCSVTKANINTSRSNTKTLNGGENPVAIIESINAFVEVYPNPSNGQVKISLPEVLLGCKIILMNVIGQVLAVYVINSTEFYLDYSQFENGIFFMQIETEQSNIIRKLIKN
jgi:hypothetical protein